MVGEHVVLLSPQWRDLAAQPQEATQDAEQADGERGELKGKLVVGDALIELRVQERFAAVGPVGDARDGVARQEKAENTDGEKYRADEKAKDPVAGELTIAQALHCVALRARSRTRGSKPSSCCRQNSASAPAAHEHEPVRAATVGSCPREHLSDPLSARTRTPVAPSTDNRRRRTAVSTACRSNRTFGWFVGTVNGGWRQQAARISIAPTTTEATSQFRTTVSSQLVTRS